tara:strand:- start:704 stop:1369 length:666 start_codon:yes stop_codon:yes gene_type:complete
MDVTEEILRNTQIYGASDYTAHHSLASAKVLNYAEGASIQKPIQEKITVIPRMLKYQDSVGLFGAENVFIKVTLKILDSGNSCFEEPGWQCMKIIEVDDALFNTYYTAVIDTKADLDIENTYEPAQMTNVLPAVPAPYVGISLNNLKTGNKYVDAWFDVRLYTKAREEHPYDEMYVPYTDYFYIGFHARNTKRLPYNVECLIGTGFKTKNDIDPKLIAKVN